MAEIVRCRRCGGAGAVSCVPRCCMCGGPGDSGAGCEFCPDADTYNEVITAECFVCRGLGTVIECPVCHGAADECRRCHGSGYVPGRGAGSRPERPVHAPL